jgi:hypothetical protein
MATRTIVTSQPDVACDVCERRLLRGEQPDVFLAAGRRRIVCELCAPRAAHEGWMRETDSHPVTLPPMRSRRGRSFLDRLRQVARPPGEPAAGAADIASEPGHEPAQEQGSYDLFDGYTRVGAEPVPAPPAQPHERDGEAVAADPEAHAREVGAGGVMDWQDAPAAAPSETTPAFVELPSEYVQEAIAVFNASEFPRRVAGVTRSLGAPLVNVRSAEHLASVVSIVVAWELCWYRYEIDLSEPVVEAQVIAQGTELAELAREDRHPNATAGDSGKLELAAV